MTRGVGRLIASAHFFCTVRMLPVAVSGQVCKPQKRRFCRVNSALLPEGHGSSAGRTSQMSGKVTSEKPRLLRL